MSFTIDRNEFSAAVDIANNLKISRIIRDTPRDIFRFRFGFRDVEFIGEARFLKMREKKCFKYELSKKDMCLAIRNAVLRNPTQPAISEENVFSTIFPAIAEGITCLQNRIMENVPTWDRWDIQIDFVDDVLK